MTKTLGDQHVLHVATKIDVGLELRRAERESGATSSMMRLHGVAKYSF